MDQLIDYFNQLASRLPLELFVMVGTFIEEVISPLPSFMVLLPAGAAAQVQGMSWWYLGVLCLLSGVGRIAGGILLYWIADRSEDWLLRRHRFFGVSHSEVERFGQRLGRSGWRDWWLLFAMNAVPIFPTAVLSIACGFVKVRFWLFVTTTFFGTLINAFVYLAIGYAGLLAAHALRGIEVATQLTTALLLVLGVIWLLRRRFAATRLRPPSARRQRTGARKAKTRKKTT